MDDPLSLAANGIKIKPELMEKEKLYHVIFNNKIILVFKDFQDVLQCYEIEEKEIVDKVKHSSNVNIEKILEEFVKNQTSKIK